MAFAEGGSDGTLNGITDVTIVSAPGASTKRLVRYIAIYNADTADVTVTVKLYNGTNERIIKKATLAAGDTLEYSGPVIVLDDTSTILEAVMSGAAATTNPDYITAYADAS